MRTVHILLHGFALCQFSDKVPREWPEGHVWIGLPEYMRGQGIKIGATLCTQCDYIARQRPPVRL